MRFILAVTVMVALAGPGIAQDPTGFEIRAEYLLRRQDQGGLPTSMMVAMLRDPFPETRMLAVRVVAASADPSQAPLLAEYRRDRDFRVRYEVMLAAGRMGDAGRGLALGGLGDGIASVRQAAAWAACHTGDAALEPVIRFLATETDTGVQATALANLWRFERPEWIAVAARAAASGGPQLRRAAVYSLARSDRAEARAALRSLAADAEPVIRATAVAGLRRSALARDDRMVVARALGDADPRVRIAGCWVLAERPETTIDDTMADAVAGLWASSEPQLAAMALRAAGAHPAIGDNGELLRIATEGEPWLATEAFAAAARRGAEGIRELAAGYLDSGEPWRRRAVAASASRLGPELESAVRDDPDPSVRLARLEGLPTDPGAPRRATLRAVLDGDPDPAVRAAALELLVAGGRLTRVDELLGLADRWTSDPEPFARAAAFSAAIAAAADAREVERILELARADAEPVVAIRAVNAARAAGHPAAPVEREPRHGQRWYGELVDWMQRSHWLDVVTDRGSFRIRLASLEAPITSREVVDLAAAGFYDDTVFHRVVPNFVVQGGDPRGDGWGGAGFVLPDEPAFRPFDAWRVGIATDGPNTGSGQLFVTTMPADHLTGHYTNLGEVVAGREVLTRLRVGDRIREVVAVSGDEPPPLTPVLLGELEWTELAALDGWSAEHAGYEPNPELVAQLATAAGSYSISTVLGTWCSDSEREVPRLVKVLDAVGGESFEHRLVGVDRTRRIDDPALADDCGVERTVERVATIVVADADGTELGRVVETADAPIEQLLVEFIAPAEGW